MSSFVASERSGNWVVVAHAEHVSVTALKGRLVLATASSDRILVDGVDSWWIGRVFVRQNVRRQGYGKECVRRLVGASQKMSPCRIVVAPGGYGTSPDTLEAFYQACGFTEVEPGLFEVKAL